MPSLLIVDDEPLVRVGLESMLDWDRLGIDVVGTASNGSQALKIIRTEHPDIVITDIRMSTMTGLELISLCRNDPSASPCFIVLTSYEEIEYLREAIRLDAVDYLIKLELTPEILEQSIRKAVSTRNVEGASPENRSVAERSGILREVFFIRLINRAFTSVDEIRAAMASVGAQLPGFWFSAIVFRIGFPESIRTPDKQNDLLFCAMRMLSDLSNPTLHLEMLHLDSKTFVAIAALDAPQTDADAAGAILIDALTSRLPQTEKYFNLTISAGLGSLKQDMAQIPDSYSDARKVLESLPAPSGLAVFDPQSVKTQNGRPDLPKEIHGAVLSRNADGIEKVLDKVLLTMDRENSPFSSCLDICCSIVYQVLAASDVGEDLLDMAFPGDADGYRCLYRTTNVGETRQWITRLREGLSGEFRSNGLGYSESVVSRIRAFLDDHYLERIDLKRLADEFSMSPNYISTLFKKHIGMGIIAYQNERRIDHAKDIMRSGKWKMYEISDMAGFESPYYFSKVFKRVVGVSPRDWLGCQSDQDFR